MKVFIFVFIVFVLIFGLVISYFDDSSNIDSWAHLGGLITGFCFYMAVNKPEEAADGALFTHKTWFYSCIITLAVYAITGFSCLFALDLQ